jgi:hypothetical protein
MIEGNMVTSKHYAPLTCGNFTYIPGSGVSKIDTGNKKIIGD